MYASAHALYFEYYWFSAIMHLLGGSILGLLWLWFVGRAGKSHSVWTTLAFVLFIGVSWEIFEYVFDIAYAGRYYAIDTSVDILMDVLGALLMYVFFKNKFIQHHE